MFSLRAWLRRLLSWTAKTEPSVRVRRGRRGGCWFSRGRGPRLRRSGDPYRQSASWPYERLEPIALLAGVDNWIGGAAGAWNVGTNWSNGVPTSLSVVTITGNVTVTSSTSTTIAGLSVGTGATLVINSSSFLQVSTTGAGTVTDDGTIQIGDSSTSGELSLSGTNAIQPDSGDTGSIVFAPTSGNNNDTADELFYGSGLTIGQAMTVTAAAGQIVGSGNLTNEGLIQATSSGATFNVSLGTAGTNMDSIIASGGATVNVTGLGTNQLALEAET
ncbi:MAG TPA: hypothetical protein VG125_23420, partial [Pirellulales bacterium]|nr:hypothetical protein [Pirellulales bacterium]